MPVLDSAYISIATILIPKALKPYSADAHTCTHDLHFGTPSTEQRFMCLSFVASLLNFVLYSSYTQIPRTGFVDMTPQSPFDSFSTKSSNSYFPSIFSDSSKEVDQYTVPALDDSPPKPKGQYCYYTKKKDEAEMAHQDEGVRMIMLILQNWLSKSLRSRHQKN